MRARVPFSLGGVGVRACAQIGSRHLPSVAFCSRAPSSSSFFFRSSSCKEGPVGLTHSLSRVRRARLLLETEGGLLGRKGKPSSFPPPPSLHGRGPSSFSLSFSLGPCSPIQLYSSSCRAKRTNCRYRRVPTKEGRWRKEERRAFGRRMLPATPPCYSHCATFTLCPALLCFNPQLGKNIFRISSCSVITDFFLPSIPPALWSDR